MSDTTRLQLPLMAASQAQKHVTHNEAILTLDALVQMSALSFTASAQPASPSDGDIYLLPSGKTGADWGGYSDDAIAHYYDGVWHQYHPGPGWLCFVRDTKILYFYDGSAWSRVLANLSDGSAAAPALAFSADGNTGLYRIGSDILGLSAGGAEKLRLASSGLSLDGGTSFIAITSGTWTPTVRFTVPGDSSISYAAQSGNYQVFAIGSVKFTLIQMLIAFTPNAYTTAGGTLRFTLPTTVTAGNQPIPTLIDQSHTFPTGMTGYQGQAISGAAEGYLAYYGSGAASANGGITQFPASTTRNIRAVGMYASA